MAESPTRLVVVDGSNVARNGAWRAAWPHLDDGMLHGRLIDAVTSWAATHGCHVELIFDGSSAGHVTPRTGALVRVMHARSEGARDADELIEQRLTARARSGGRADLVTDDRAIRAATLAIVDRVLAADQFVRELIQPADPVNPQPQLEDMGGTAGASRIMDHVDESVRAQLERLRRNQ